jgi:hypothetical protein
VKIHIFLTSALVGGEWSASRPGRFTPGERAPGTHYIGGWVDPKSGLYDVEKGKFLSLVMKVESDVIRFIYANHSECPKIKLPHCKCLHFRCSAL